jgi:hypothetical protein
MKVPPGGRTAMTIANVVVKRVVLTDETVPSRTARLGPLSSSWPWSSANVSAEAGMTSVDE